MIRTILDKKTLGTSHNNSCEDISMSGANMLANVIQLTESLFSKAWPIYVSYGTGNLVSLTKTQHAF